MALAKLGVGALFTCMSSLVFPFCERSRFEITRIGHTESSCIVNFRECNIVLCLLGFKCKKKRASCGRLQMTCPLLLCEMNDSIWLPDHHVFVVPLRRKIIVMFSKYDDIGRHLYL